MDFNRRLADLGAEGQCALRVERSGRERVVKVQLASEGSFFNADLIRKRTGASLQELTPELARAFGMGNVNGLLVAGVDKGSAADNVRLDRGMVITRMGGRAVLALVDCARLIHGKAPGDKVILEVVVPRQRGRFYTLEQVTVEWTLP
jgi:S1-C subfamily serine protease